MITIETSLLPATNTLGTRIKAKAENGNSYVMGYDYAKGIRENHKIAAEKLAKIEDLLKDCLHIAL